MFFLSSHLPFHINDAVWLKNWVKIIHNKMKSHMVDACKYFLLFKPNILFKNGVFYHDIYMFFDMYVTHSSEKYAKNIYGLLIWYANVSTER